MTKDGNGFYYVLDDGKKISKYSPNFGYMMDFNHLFSNAASVTSDISKNTIYVLEKGLNMISIFSSDGKLSSQFGGNGTGNGKFISPVSIGFSVVDKTISILDDKKLNIQIFSSSGDFLSQFGGQGSSNGQFLNPSSISYSGNGNLLVSDSGKNNVQIFSIPNYSYIDSFPIVSPSHLSNYYNSCSCFILSDNLITRLDS